MLSPAETKAVTALFSRYRDIVSENSEKLTEMPNKCTADHLIRLCEEAVSNSQVYPFDKLCRWMGFVQGILAGKGLIDVDIERDFSRPLLHALHDGHVPSYP